MRKESTMKRLLASLAFAAVLAPASAFAAAPPGAAAPAQPPATPQAAAPLDVTGNWVAIVNEDWRWRMITPPRGDFPGIPLTAAGRAAANAWDPATDGSCKVYGVGGVMRMPGRLRITWQDPRTLKVETDAGVQTRLLHFQPGAPAPGAPSLQGHSIAQWRRPALVPAQVAGGIQVGNAFQPPGGELRVTTTNHTGGWVRRNGVVYSPNAVINEFWVRFRDQTGQEWLSVLTEVVDPTNFNVPFLTSSHFKKEPDGSKWRPKPCRAD